MAVVPDGDKGQAEPVFEVKLEVHQAKGLDANLFDGMHARKSLLFLVSGFRAPT